MKTRREILKALLGLASGCALPVEAQAVDSKRSAPTHSPFSGAMPKLSQWTGDDFALGHRFRARMFPSFPEHEEHTVDFAIVGGGMGALSAAYYLRDHDFLLLEQYEELGGQSRGASYRNTAYSYGPAAVATIDGIYGDLYSAVGTKPYQLDQQSTNFLAHEHGFHALSTATGQLAREFKHLLDSNSAAMRRLPAEDTPAAVCVAEFSQLQATPFRSLLQQYSAGLHELVDNICKTNFCATADTLSALAGLYVLKAFTSPAYCFQGGNAAITRALIDKLRQGGSDRLVGGAFVWRIKLDDNGANVYYTTADGTAHNVRCRHAVVATPPMVAWRQFVNMSDKMRAYLMPFKYGAYLVANMLLKKNLSVGAYENWLTAATGATCLVDAQLPYKLAGKEKEGATVLTVYQPWTHLSAGRSLLLEGDRAALTKPMLDQLAAIMAELVLNIDEVVLTRWGHAMPVPSPGYHQKLLNIANSYDAPYSFAYGATQGMQSAEAAIRAGKFAAQRASAQKKTSMIVPALIAQCCR